jgi:hypothetical protein
MKHVVGICTLIAVALIVRFCSSSTLGLDIHIHDTYQAIACRGIAFCCLIGIAGAWLLFFALTSIRRPS